MGKLISTTHNDKEIVFKRNEIMNEYEQDWDDENIYYKVDKAGWITKIHIVTCDVYKYHIERVTL